MKRLPAAEVAQSPETVAEKSVESLASHSVEGSDVVTEAMAEVWARQGNRQKAIETYNKLSLQNPSKRTYFAAKIENLS
jgi:O-methyltransferase involved in polyketide biosynthesis